MHEPWYSVRMRASRQGAHLSGAERIARQADISVLTAALTERALNHAGGPADEVHCTVERLAGDAIRHARLPSIQNRQVPGWRQGRRLAAQRLAEAGVSRPAIDVAMAALAGGAGPGGSNMRGAMIVDATSGRRLEEDPARGVRVSHMDLHPDERPQVERALAAAGLWHHRVLEALVLAGKAVHVRGLLAELCWSDDPDYLTGYVATPEHGYLRIQPLKEAGSGKGGRAFFVDCRRWQRAGFVAFLETVPMLLHGPVQITAAADRRE